MSETITQAPITTVQQANDSLINPQFILAAVTMLIVAGTVAAVVWHGDDGNVKLVLGFVFGMGSGVGAFYFGSSKSSQSKDAVLASQVAPQITNTITGPPTRITTATGSPL